jgi:hypothetical protein
MTMTGGNGKPAPAAEPSGVPVLTPWSPTPPARFLPNVDSTDRGHIMGGQGKCIECGQIKPARGGFSIACDRGAARRDFKGAA